MSNPTEEYVHKIIIIGDPAVGKTSLRRTYMGESFNTTYIATIGADFSYLKRGNTKFSIWDIAGEPNYKSVRKHFYLGAAAAIFVFDITRPDTLSEFQKWVKEIESDYPQPIPYIIVGNKEDLRDEEEMTINRKDTETKVAQWERDFNMKLPVYFSSAKTGFNVETVFTGMMEMINDNRNMQLEHD